MVDVFAYIDRIARWRRSEVGATAVEFVIILPVMLLTFAVIAEGSRIYWNYQSAVSGVRDASRYLARITNNDVCNGGTAPANAVTIATGMIQDTMQVFPETAHGGGAGAGVTDSNGARLFPPAVTLAGATPVIVTVNCIAVGSGVGTVPVYRVDARVEIQLPLNALWGFFIGGSADRISDGNNGNLFTTITDQSRIYGL